MSSFISETAVQLEARRRVSEEQNAARATALKAQQQRETEKIRLIEAQREDRVRREAEQIQARLRAEEAEREARRLAEQEAFEKAVSEQVASLKGRPLEERMLAEVEELRHIVSTLSSQLSSTLQTPPPSYGLDSLQSKIASLSTSPWNSGIEQLKAQLGQISSQISAQNSQLADIRSLATKPARSISIFASAMTLSSLYIPSQNAHAQSVLPNPSGARVLLATYNVIHQGASSASSAQNFLEVPENSVGTIAVPAGQKVYIVSAHWKPHNNVRSGATILDVTGHLKAMGIENQ
jgi:DNA repair exonuclease SbcCD ATPase subunit